MYNSRRLCPCLNPTVFVNLKKISHNIQQRYFYSDIVQRLIPRINLLCHTNHCAVDVQGLTHNDASNNGKQQIDLNDISSKTTQNTRSTYICILSTHTEITSLYERKSYDKIIENYGTSLDNISQDRYLHVIGAIHIMLGNCYEFTKSSKRNYDRAYYHYECALAKYGKHLELNKKIDTLCRLAHIFNKMAKRKQAMECFAKTFIIIETYENYSEMQRTITTNVFIELYLNIINFFMLNNESDKALDYTQQVFSFYMKKRKEMLPWTAIDQIGWICVLNFFGWIYSMHGEHDICWNYLNILEPIPANNSYTLDDEQVHLYSDFMHKSLVGHALYNLDKSKWHQCLTYMHTAIQISTKLDQNVDSMVKHIHYFMGEIWLNQLNEKSLTSVHWVIQDTLNKRDEDNDGRKTNQTIDHSSSYSITFSNIAKSIIFSEGKVEKDQHTIQLPFISHSSEVQLAILYAQLADFYNNETIRAKIGIEAKTFAIDYASIAIKLLARIDKYATQRAELQTFIDNIKELYFSTNEKINNCTEIL